jgi:magnesium-transporting ATPase (P-type)
MKRRPRVPHTPLLTPLLLWRICFVSLLLVGGTFGHFLLVAAQPDATVEYARTVAINTLVIGQMFYLFNSRYIVAPSWNWRGIFGSRPVLLAAITLLVLQALFTYTAPMQPLFQTVPLALGDWLRIFAFGLFVFLAVEIEKVFLRRRTGKAGNTTSPIPCSGRL